MESIPSRTPDCETALVMAALLGDLQAFDALVRRYRRAVVVVAEEALGSRDLAEDVTQEVFVLAFKALPQLQDPTRFASWLYAIARNRARRVSLQSRKFQPTESSVLDRLILAHCQEITVHPADECVRRSERTYIPEFLAQLAPELRLVLRLRYYEEWSVGEISEFLMLPNTTVKWRLHQGRCRMRALLTAHRQKQENNVYAT